MAIFASIQFSSLFGRHLFGSHRRWLVICLGVLSTIAVIAFSSCSAFQSSALASPPNILIDQFGYRPSDPKVAVIQQANATTEDDPNLYQHLNDTFQVIDVEAPDAPVYTASAEIWADGKIHDQSGDRVAWFDFSTVQTPGNYVIQNTRTGETSAQFAIAPDVYQNVLKTATRMYYYQRSGFQ